MERRDYLKYLAAVVVGLGVGGAGGYMSGSQQAGPVTEVTETKTVTVTGEAPPATQPPAAKQFEGQNVVIQIEAGWQEEQYHYYGKIWTENTGCTLTVVGTPVGGSYEKLITEFVAGTGAYDIVYVLPIWSGDIMGAGYLLELDNYFAKADPWLDDIMPAFKESYMKWGGKWYGITADGDVLSLYYRKDLFGQQDAKDEFKSEYGYDLKVPESRIP
jgi:multiple sugar transport system substrate-binding protein